MYTRFYYLISCSKLLTHNSTRLVPYNTEHMVTNHSSFGTQVRLTLDIAIAIYLITLFILFSLFYTTGSPRERDQQEGPGAIIPQQLAAVTEGPVGISTLLDLASRLETKRAQVSLEGVNPAHFLEGIEVNQRDPRQGEKNGHMIHPPDTSWQ